MSDVNMGFQAQIMFGADTAVTRETFLSFSTDLELGFQVSAVANRLVLTADGTTPLALTPDSPGSL